MSCSDLLRGLPELDEAYIAAFEAAYSPDGAGPGDDEAGRERILALHREEARIARRLRERAVRSADPGHAQAARVISAVLRGIEAMERRTAEATARHAAAAVAAPRRAGTR